MGLEIGASIPENMIKINQDFVMLLYLKQVINMIIQHLSKSVSNQQNMYKVYKKVYVSCIIFLKIFQERRQRIYRVDT